MSNAPGSLMRSYSTLLSEEAGLPVEILREALTLKGREPSTKDQALSAAQRIARLRARNARKSEAPSTGVTDDVTVESDTPLLQRSYSALCADKAGVPIFFMKEALQSFDVRDETVKAEVMSAAQRIWKSRQPESPSSPKRIATEELDLDSALQSLERSYSTLCAKEAGVPLGIMQRVMIKEGRDESAKAKVMSVAQMIWKGTGTSNKRSKFSRASRNNHGWR